MLEKVAVTPEVMSKYESTVDVLVKHLKRKGVGMRNDAELDAGIADYMTMKFFAGEEAYFGDKLVAAVGALWPEHGPPSLPPRPRLALPERSCWPT